MPDKRKKHLAYLYTRVSTTMQVDGFSLDAQRERLMRAAEYHQLSVVREFSDAGISGKNTTDRPQFTEMLRLIENGNPDGVRYVLVFKLSRFARNAADVLCNLEAMQPAKDLSSIKIQKGLNIRARQRAQKNKPIANIGVPEYGEGGRYAAGRTG